MTLLVMTATIRPPANAPRLNWVNVADRLEDYRRGLRHNLKVMRQGNLSGIVFVDNSGYGTSEMAEIVKAEGGDLIDRVELISYDQGAGSPNQTRFAGECKLLRHAFSTSRLIAQSDQTYAWKVTGRYVVRNLGLIVIADYGDSDLILHCRNYPIPFVDFGLAGFRRSRVGDIMEAVMRIPEIERRDEAALRAEIDNGALAGLRVAKRFRQIPDFSGVRGSDQASYDGVGYRMKYMARVAANRIFPQMWI